MEYLVGGRFACMTCLRRGTSPECLRCGDDRADVIDLETPEGRFRLSMTRAAGRLGSLGIPFWDPRAFRSLPVGRTVLRVGMAIAFCAGFAGPFVLDHGFSYEGSTQLELFSRTVVAIMVGLAGAAMWVGVVTVVVLALLGLAGVIAQGMAALAAVLGLLARVLPGEMSRTASRAWLRVTVAAERNVMRGALTSVERAFTSRLRVAAPAPAPVRALADGRGLRGTLRAGVSGAPIVAVLDDSGAVELRDARVAPFELVGDDGSVAWVDVASGTVEIDGEPDDDAPDVESAPPVVPDWADLDSERRGRARCVVVPAGARLEVSGGEWSEELDRGDGRGGFRDAPVRRVLRGTVDAPARVRILAG